MKFLITGGAGFIGSHLTGRLIEEGHAVMALDDLSTGSLKNIDPWRGHPHFKFVRGSVLDAGAVRKHVLDSNHVIHLAAAVGVRRILRDPLHSIQTNIDGTDHVLSACAEFGRPLLLASTSEIYGKNESVLCEESDSILGPSSVMRWSYAAAKKLDEFLALAYAAERGVAVTITRFFNIVGPRQSARYGMVLPNFVRSALAGEPILVFGDGTQTRNFTYIDDCLDALMLLLRTPVAAGKIFNIGGDEEVSIQALAERVRQASGSSSSVVRVPYAEAYPEGGYEDMHRRVPCICRIEALTGWNPRVSIDEIISRTIAHERKCGTPQAASEETAPAVSR